MFMSSPSKLIEGYNSTGGTVTYKPEFNRPVIRWNLGSLELTYLSLKDENRRFMISLTNDFQSSLTKKGISVASFKEDLDSNL